VPVVALCDVDERVLSRRAERYKERGREVATFTDYRKLLEDPNIDAVSIATPNHLHAIITIAAVQAGKHVYVEKPASHNVWEGRQMVAAARKYGKIVQLGTQCRSSQGLIDAHKWIHEGNLGAIQYAVGTCYKRRGSIGKSDAAFEFPSFVHKDLWIGPAADEPFYRPQENSQGGGKYNPHYDWHWDFNTGGGDLGNQGIHQMDIARWFLGEPALAPRVLSIGGRLGYEDAGNTANTQIVYHAYPKAPLIFEVRGLPQGEGRRRMDNYRGSEIGVVVQCEKGHLLIPSYTSATAYDAEGNEVKEWNDGGRHHDNWLSAIVANDPKLQTAEIHTGHVSSALCHTGNASYRVGKKAATAEIADQVKEMAPLADSFKRMCEHLKNNNVDLDGEPVLTMGQWLDVDPATEKFVGNDAAMKFWKREGRGEFLIPDLESEAPVTAVAAG
jgi:predicted dehydrogenase